MSDDEMPAGGVRMTIIDERVHIHEVRDDGSVNCLIQLTPEHADEWIKGLWHAKQRVGNGADPS